MQLLPPLTTTTAAVGLAVGAAGALALLMLLRRRNRPPPALNKPKTAAGHDGNLEEGGYFYKLEVKNRFENERAFLEKMRSTSDPLARCAPEYHGVEEREGKRYLKMSSLTSSFDTASLCIMDVKMGVRCFAESELDSTKPRPDLFQKLLKLGPPLTSQIVTAAEQDAKEITKARWMLIRDATSSTHELGFRVDGVETPTCKRKPSGDLATCRQDAQVIDALCSFLPKENTRKVAEQILIRLDEIDACMRRSEVFPSHEVIGSSLLFAADAKGHVGVTMLDFGLTCPADVPGGRLRHDVPWTRGNHEDGYLIGMANLRRLWRRMLDGL